jgi:hypothetical protein
VILVYQGFLAIQEFQDGLALAEFQDLADIQEQVVILVLVVIAE